MIFKISDDKKHIEIEHKGEKGASFDDFCSKLPDGDCRYAVLDVEIDTKSGATANKLIFVAWCAWHVRSRATSGGGGGGGAGAEEAGGRGGWGGGGSRTQGCAHAAHVAALRSRRCGPLCRSDDNASVKPKMLYASSKDALKKALTGINDEYQATESASWLIRLAGSSRAHGTTATRAALQLRASARAEPRAPRAPGASGHAPSLGGQHPAAACVPAGRWWPRCRLLFWPSGLSTAFGHQARRPRLQGDPEEGWRRQVSSLCSPGGLGVRRSATQGSGWGRVAVLDARRWAYVYTRVVGLRYSRQ